MQRRLLRSRQPLASAVLAMVFSLVGTSALLAQSTALLRGAITDEQGSIVPGAMVAVRNEATGEERATASDKVGAYLVASLPPGVYRIEVKAQGFKARVIKELRLEVAQTTIQDVRLAVGDLSEEIAILAEAPVIASSTTSVGQVISERTVQEIPLNGRHFVDLGLLIPGSVAPQQNGFLTAPLRGQGSFAFNTAGNREDTVNFMINGVNLNDQVQNQITFQPSINTVSEFKVDNSTLSAEYGRSSGAVVNIATRSGSNKLRGEAFEFFRHQSLDARNFFNTDSQKQSPFKRNQFGANLGGPIVKNQTFFFLTYEGLRQRQALDFNSGVLSEAQRAGVTDPVAKSLLALIPSPNTTTSTGAARFLGTGSADVNIDQWTGDLSHQLGQSDRLHAYYAFQKDQRVEPNLQGNTIPGFGDTRSSHRQIGTLNYTHMFGSSLVNEARLGFNRINITFAPNVTDNPQDLGINNGITTAVVLPQITIQGPGLNFGGPANFPQGRTDTTLVVSDTLSYQRGRHALKFGGEYRSFHNINFQTNGGTFVYPSVADFQKGRGTQFTVTLGDIDSDVTQKAVGFFVQDNFKMKSNLTLELGFRYDLVASPTEADNRFVYFDPATVSLQRVGQGTRDKIYDNKGNYEPRVGIVWDPFNDGRTSVRAAYALLSDQPVTNVVTPTAGNPPLVTPLSFTGAAGSIRLDNALSVAQAAGLAPQSVDGAFQNPRIQTWNLNVQREIFKNLGLLVGYFGSKGDHLRISRNVNQFVSGVRPYPRLSASSPILPGSLVGNITEITSLGYSRYNALWVSLNQRMSHGLQFNASYTLSSSKDTNSLNSQGVVVQNSFDIASDYAASDYDARHRYVLSALWELPFKGNRLVEGWQVSVITQGQSGNPINVLTNIANLTGNANVRPDLVGTIDVLGKPDQWYSTAVCDPRIAGSCTSASVFALPVSATGALHFGNLPRNAIIGPTFFNTDLSLVKKTKVGGATLEFRAEAFNVFNHPNFGQPGRIATVGSTSFGIITGTRFPTGDSGVARQIQFALKVLF
jgi:Carboxypeptidase regulatory-like domain/TonB dependent receptor-like, beta-barrel